jgi:hypothetical protein
MITSEDPSDFEYPIHDMLYSKYVDATPFIRRNEFRPEYCEGRIDKLIRLNPKTINKDTEEGLKAALDQWKFQNEHDIVQSSIHDKLRYRFTQFFNRKPIDNYELFLTDECSLHIRFADDGTIFGGFNDHPWVSNSCEE